MNMLSNETKTGPVEKKREKEFSSSEGKIKERKERKKEGKEEGESKTKRTSAGFSGSWVLWSSAAV